MRILLLPPLFLPPAEVYEAMADCDLVVYDINTLYDKRAKTAHRTIIEDTHGPLTLTVPVSRPHGINRPTWHDVTVSAHNEWWRAMTGAITTAYSPTPFFMHLWPEIAPFISEQSVGLSVADLDLRLDAVVRRLLGITTPASTILPPGDHVVIDLRKDAPVGISILNDLFAGHPISCNNP